jgi:hypothetical protein
MITEPTSEMNCVRLFAAILAACARSTNAGGARLNGRSVRRRLRREQGDHRRSHYPPNKHEGIDMQTMIKVLIVLSALAFVLAVVG